MGASISNAFSGVDGLLRVTSVDATAERVPVRLWRDSNAMCCSFSDKLPGLLQAPEALRTGGITEGDWRQIKL